MVKAVALVCLLFVVAVFASDAEGEMELDAERPRLTPAIIIGAPRRHRRGSTTLKVVMVPKGDPRARPPNPFLPQSPFAVDAPAGLVLRSGTPFGTLTVSQLVASMPGLSSSKATTVLPFMNAAMKEAEVNTCERAAAFLAQLGHESGSLVYMEEIASGAAYEGRRDLGNTQPGDGKRFKGRGPIQLTGRANYAAAGKALGLDLINNPTSVATYPVGFRTSAWFWKSNGLNAFADQGAFSTITRRINGGTNGAADRNMRWGKAKVALGCVGDPFPGCTSKGGKCQIGGCTGTVVRGVCGAGAETCCVPKAAAPVLRSTAPAASAITLDQLLKCMRGLPKAKAQAVLPFMNAAQAEAGINTCRRKAAWIAQLGHESGSLVYMEEIASGAAYEGRRDLGNTQPGDGKRFKGRGPIQLTGRTNYKNAGDALKLDLIKNPASVATYPVGFRTSAWFWKTHGLNALADQGAFSTITRRINGGTNGAADRNARYAVARKVLGC